MDGVEYRGEHFVVALGIDKTGLKTVLGFHQGASENQQICDRLLADLASRGLDRTRASSPFSTVAAACELR
jgi:transposase-like protein